MKTKLFTLLFALMASTMTANALQTYTVSEAIAAFDAGTLMTGDSCQIIGAISKWCPKTTAFSTYKSISYYVTDGAKEFEFYCSYSLGKAQYKYYNYNSDSSALCVDMNGKSLFLGDTVIGAGKIKKYGDIYEFDMNCYLKEIRPAKPSPFIVAEGTCGENATWAISYPGWVLNITGDGAIQRSNNYWDLYKLYIDSVAIGEGITEIGDSAFYNCSSLTSVIVPNSITSIGNKAFYNCTGLTSVTIPNGVTSIGHSAFEGCPSLTSVHISDLAAWCNISFGDNANPLMSAHNLYLNGDLITNLTIPNSVASIGNQAFYNCVGLTSVAIGNSVTSIGNSAFYGCTGLSSVEIPNSVTSIGNSAFFGCTGLTSIEIPNSVDRIGENAFYGCSKLTSAVTIPNSVDSIGYETFSGCKIKQIHYSGTLQEWIGKSWNPIYMSSSYSLYIGDELLKDLIIPNDITSIRSNAFACCNSLTSVTIPNSATRIGVGAFNYCSSLNSVYISDLAAWCNISFGAGGAANPLVTARNLYLNGNLVTDLVLPNTVTVIKAGTFVNCTCLTSVTIPNSVNTIEGALQNEDQGIIYILGCGAFQGCTGLTSVTIPNSVDSIGAHAFYDCNRLSSVYVLSEEPPTLSRANCFPTSTTIYVPCGQLETYQTAEGWSAYASNMRYEPSLLAKLAISMTPMEGGYIEGITDSISVCLNSDFALTAIPNDGYCFTQWSDGNTDNPRIIAVSQDTTFSAEFGIAKKGTCGVNRALTWEYEEKSKTLTISGEGELTENYMYGFEAPTQMQKLVIGNDVTAIGDSAFYAMNTINHLFIGSGVASIGNYAFAECRNFDDITCYATTVPTINATTFYNVGNKQYIYLYVPADRERAYKRDTYWGEFDIQIQSAESTTTGDEIKIEPTDNTAAVTWPVVDGADSYELVIKDKEGNVICTLVFNAQGQLTSIAFNAPGRNAPQQTQTAGFSFTVTGLEEGTSYDLTLTAKDSGGNTLDSKTVSFSTEGDAPQGIDQITNDKWEMTNKIIRDGQVFILRGNKTYTLTGQEVK